MRGLMYISLFAVLTSLLTACEKDLDIRYLSGDAKMVINCQVDNRQPIKVYVTESISLTGSAKPKCITGAIVELYKNDSLLQILPFAYTDSGQTFGCYQYTNAGEPGNKYSVKVTHPVFGTATGTDNLPAIPAVVSHGLTYYGDSTTGYQTRYSIKLSDNAGQNSFYRLSIWQWGRRIMITPGGDTTIVDYTISSKPRPLGLLTDTIRENNNDLLFSDKSFNGQLKQIDFSATGAPLNEVLEAHYLVELSEVSAPHYNYVKSLALRNDFNTGSGNENAYSNVQNAYGIFMSRSIYSMYTRVK